MNDLSKDAVTRIAVGDEEAGQRVDNYLLRVLKGVPKSHVYRIVRSGEVRVNRHRVGPDTRLVSGDVVRIPPIRTRAAAPKAAPRAAASIPVPPILFEDEALLALDKPPGLAVHGGSGISHGVIERLRLHRPEARFLELVHRLDRDTSGVLAFALSREARAGLIDTFRHHRIERGYLAIVEGEPTGEGGTIDAPLREGWVSGRRAVARPGEEQRPARTRWRVRERLPGAALPEVRLETGRQHQIRVHLAHVGLPILGDPVYGRPARGRPLARRPMLHAFRLAFAHPVTGERVSAESPPPEDFERALLALRRRSR